MNFACYYRMLNDWNPETYTTAEMILKYLAGSAKIKWNLNISWWHDRIGLKPRLLIHMIRVPYFGYSLRLMFSCNLWILFIKQHNEGRSVAEHVCVVLLYNAIPEYHVAVAVATAVRALDVVKHCNILLRVPPAFPHHMYYLSTHTIVVFFWGETRRKFIELGDGGWAVSFHVCINYVLIFFVVVLFSNAEFLFERESEPNLGDLYNNM